MSSMEMKPVPNAGYLKIKAHMVDPGDGSPVPIIRLDSNENALGPSPNAVAAAKRAADDLNLYLANQATVLGPALAQHYMLDPERIAIGCGSDDILARIVKCFLRPGRKLLRSANSYLKTPRYAFAANGVPVSVPDSDFTLQVDKVLACGLEDVDVVYLANPDNPSGTMIPNSEIRRLHQNLPPHVLMVVDCAYEEYAERGSFETLKELVEMNANVIFTRTFSKVFGLAGARVGWAYGSPNIVRVVDQASLTFPIARPSMHAALAALEDTDHVRQVIDHNTYVRAKYSRAFEEMGLKVYPSQANFLLLELSGGSPAARGLSQFLVNRGIWIRRFASPSFSSCVRITLGKGEDLDETADLIRQYLET